MRRFAFAFAMGCVLAAAATTAWAADTSGQTPDFPPGLFTDNHVYHLSDFQGKVVVLYFGCNICPRNRGSVPERNKIVQQYRDKPVKFLAIMPAPLSAAREYANGTHLLMPCFADAMGVMQHRYGTSISLNNIWQFRVIGPDGKIVAQDMQPEDIDHAIKDVKWKYRDDGYDPKLAGIVDLLEWNQYESAMRLLRPWTKQKTKTGQSAQALYDKVKTEAGQWSADADKAMDSDKARAFDLYSKVAACFPDDDLGKHAAEALKTLKKDKAVTDELAARQMYARLYLVMSQATSRQKAQVVAYCQSISTKYPDTPTGKTAADLAQELQDSSVEGG